MQAYQAAAQQLGALGYQNAAMRTQALQNAAQGLGSLGADQQARAIANLQGAAQGMGSLGSQSQQAYLQSLNALNQAGLQQQQIRQQQLTNNYNQWLQAKAYPYQQTSYLAGLASGVGPLLGATTTQQGSQNSTGTGAQLGMQPYQNQSGGGGLAGLATTGLGLLGGFFGFKDGGRVTGRKAYAQGGPAQDEDSDELDFGSAAAQSSPYGAGGPGTSDLGSLVGQQPYAGKGGNYATESLKLAKIIPSAKQVAAERLSQAIAQAITGIPQHGEVAPVSREITSSFFGAQEPSSSVPGGGGSLRSSRGKSSEDNYEDEQKTVDLGSLSPDELEEARRKGSGGFGSILSDAGDKFSSFLGGDSGGFLASGGRVHREDGGATTQAAPVAATTTPAPAPVPTPRLSPQEAAAYVQGLYNTQLGRPADQQGFDYLTNQLQQGLKTRADVSRLFAESPTVQNAITDVFQTNLRRDPRPEGREFWTNELAAGVPISAIDYAAKAGPEYVQTGQQVQNLGSLYQGGLNRDPDPAGLDFWLAGLKGGLPVSEVSTAIAQSNEGQNKLNRLYQQDLGREIDLGGRDYWTQQLSNGTGTTLQTVRDAIRSTPEFQEYDRTHPGIVGSAEIMSPRSIAEVMDTPESKRFNIKMNPTGKTGLGFDALVKQVYEDSPGPQLSPEQQGLQGMPPASYYTTKQPTFPGRKPVVSWPTDGTGTTPSVPVNYLGLSQTAYNLAPTDFVNNLYQRYTGTTPTESQLNSAVNAINGGTSRQTVESDLAKTSPAQTRSYVTMLYNKILGRDPDEGGLQFWTNQIASGVPASRIEQDLLNVTQRDTPVVQGYYTTIGSQKINPYTGLYNVNYTAPYKSQPVPYGSFFKDGGRVGRARGGALSSRERIELAAKAALQAGATPKQAAMMAAISVPESAGNPYAHNPNARTGDNSYGLWQVNMLGGMGPQRRKQFGLSRNEELFDPVTNAKAALQIASGRGGLNNWTTYKHGKHLPYYSAAVDVVNNLVKDPSAVMAKIEAPAPLSLPTRGGEPNTSSVMYGRPPSAQEGSPSQDKGLRLSELIQNVIEPSLAGGSGSEEPKLATAQPIEPIIPLTPAPLPTVSMDDMGEGNRGNYLDTVIAMNQRARGGRLHFQYGGTDEERREQFYREQLEGSAPQYDPEAGWATADRAGELGLNLAALLPLGKAIKPLQTAYKTGKGAINAIRNMRGLAGRETPAAEPGLGALEYSPQAPRGRQPAPAQEPIPMGINVPKKDMNRFESNTEGMRRGIPGDEIWNWSTLRNPKGSQPMNKFEENQANLNWNRFGQYEPNKAPAYYDKYGNVAPPKVNYNGQSQRPISEFEANQGYFTQGIPGRDTRLNSVARGPVARGFGTRDMGFTPAELGQELVPMGPRGMSVPPSRLPAGRSNLPTLATGSRGGGSGEPPIYADYRDVTGNILNGPRGGLVPSTGGGGNLVPPDGGGRPPRNFRTKTATTMMAPPGAPPAQPVAAQMDQPHQLPDMNIYGPKKAKTAPAENRPRAKRAAPKAVDNRRYWGDWRDTEPFESDPIGNFLDSLTGDVRASRKRGNINSPMSPYAGTGAIHFADGGRAYRGEGGILGGLGDVLKSYKPGAISQGLVTAGLGMMASPQRDPLRAIGEGGLAGIQAYNTAAEREREEKKKLDQQKIDADFATNTLKKLKDIGSPSVAASDSSEESTDGLFPKVSLSPIIKRRGGSIRRAYAQGGQPQQDEGFDPFEAIGAVGDTIGSGLQSLGDTIGDALMPSAQAEEAAPSRPRRGPGPISQGLISAGLGMMASPAHNPMRAIGEGGLRGVQAYNTAAEEQRKEDKLEEERKQNETFAKTLTPKTMPAPTVEPAPTITKTAATTTPNPVVAMDRTAVETDPMAESLRRLEILQSAMPQNAAQEKFIRRQMELEKLKIAQIKYQQSAAEKAGTTSPGGKGDIKAQEELGKASADQALNVGKAAQSAQTTMSDFANMHRALREDKISPGPAAPITRKFHQFMGEVGVQSYADQAALEDEMTRLGVKQVMADLGGRLGAGISNADRDAIMEMSLNLSKSKGYNMALLEAAIKTQQRALEAQKWTDDYIKEHGRIDANYMTSYSKWASEQPALVSPSLRKLLAKEKEERLGTESSKTDDDNLPVGHVYVDPSSKKKWRKSKEGSRWDQNNWEEVQ